jgi:uncharacterized membrane protein
MMVAASSVAGSISVAAPVVRRISAADMRWALREGWTDFRQKRGDVLILGFVYPAVGILVSAFAANRSLLPLLFPLVAGLSILGPAVAGGFYELAKRREAGQEADWRHFFDPYRGPAAPGILALSLMLAVLFSAWMGVAWALSQVTLGPIAPTAGAGFFNALFTTPEGWTLIVVGNLIGLLFATVVLVVSLVSFPMVVDGRAGPVQAIAASVEACWKNPREVATWGFMVATLLALGSIPLFVGLAVVLPVLGYATWALYTRLIQR